MSIGRFGQVRFASGAAAALLLAAWMAAGPASADTYISTSMDGKLNAMLPAKVAHEIAFAREVAGHVVFMGGSEIIEQGKPTDVLGSPSHPQTQGFLANMLV